MIFSGETGAKSLRARLVGLGFGVVLVRGRVPPWRPGGCGCVGRHRRGCDLSGKANLSAWNFLYFYENGAFLDWRAGKAFDDSSFLDDVLAMAEYPEEYRPVFVTLPDAVAGGLDSLRLSLSWLHRVGRLNLRWALVVQDGMRPEDIPWEAPFDVIFVGGSLDWKLETMAAWACAAHARGRKCHVGRVGSAKRFRMARSAGVDSWDSALFLWSKSKLDTCIRVMDQPVQRRLNIGTRWDIEPRPRPNRKPEIQRKHGMTQVNLFAGRCGAADPFEPWLTVLCDGARVKL